MKILTLLLAQILTLSFACCEGFNYCDEGHKITNQFVTDVVPKYGISPYGFGGGMMDDVNKIAVCFNAYEKHYDISQARVLFVTVVDNLLNRVNSNKAIRPYLHEYPFTSHYADISIAFIDANKKILSDGSVAHTYLAHGKIFYSTFNKGADDYVTIHEEPYEEALRIIRDKAK